MPYIQLQYLGGGFFGDVWLEEDTGLGRKCAAKRLNVSRVAPGASFAEAQTMIAAEHDHVVAVYSAELEGNQPVIRMEYLPDGSVADRHGGLPVAVDEAIRIIEDACRGVAHLHVRGILHRDVKPANLLIAPTGEIKVSDFGLSCRIADLSAAPPQMYLSHLPPESAAQRVGITTPAGDVYALGVTTYRLLNGDQALRGIVPPGSDPFDAIARGKYPDRKVWLPHIHDRLRKAVLKAMHVDPNKRYSDARKFRQALEQARPRVSWWPSNPASGLEWEGLSRKDGTAWRASVEPRPRGGSRFTVNRRLLGKAWRNRPADTANFATDQEAIDFAEVVLDRIAVLGS